MKKNIGLVLILVFGLSLIGKPVRAEEFGSAQVKATLADDYWQKFSPNQVRGIYLTASTALNQKRMRQIIDFIHASEINAVVIDIKDGQEVYLIPEMAELVQELLKEKIYPIARQVVFLDNKFGQSHPEYALKKKGGEPWRDRAGNLWLDPASKEVWEYNAEVAQAAIAIGFKEVQFDYLRFPSDGTLGQIVYPVWDGQTPKYEIIKSFVETLTQAVRDFASKVPLSADIFAYTFLVKDDLGIGQRVTDLLSQFDFLSPMIYPSHYSAGNFGFRNPASYPYEVISSTLDRGQIYFKSEKKKIRPWIQDFNLGAIYDDRLVGLEKKALADFGLESWLAWNPWNKYDPKSFVLKN